MEIAPDNSKAALADNLLQKISVSPGASSFGGAETSVRGAQPPPTSLGPRAGTPPTSSEFRLSSSYSAESMSLALAEPSSAPINFFSSLPGTSGISCTSAAEAQVPTSIYPDSPCFSYEYYPSTSVTSHGTAACSSGFSDPGAEGSTAFQVCATSYGPVQADVDGVYEDSLFTSSDSARAISASESPSQFEAQAALHCDSARAISASESPSQFEVQPAGTTAEASGSVRGLDRYYQEVASVSPSISAVAENPSFSVVANGNEDPTSLRVIDDNDDPTLLRVTDDLDHLSASQTNVSTHSASFSTTVELPPQSSHPIPSETIVETAHPLPNVSVTYSSALPEPPVGASTDLSTERSSLLPSSSPLSGTSMIMSPFIVELARGFTSQSSLSSLIEPKIEPDRSPLLVPKLEPPGTVSSGSAARSGYVSEEMVPSSLDPNCRSLSGCPDLRLYASSSEPSSPSCPSSGPFSDPADEISPDCPQLRASSSPPKTEPLSTSSLGLLSSDCMPASTPGVPSASSPSSAVSFSNSLTSSPRDSSNCRQSPEPMGRSPTLTSNGRVDNSTGDEEASPGASRKGAPLSRSEPYLVGDYIVNSGPPPLPGAEVVPLGCVKKGQNGTGWPYAPQGWPNRDDKWPWRVGKRGNSNGFFKDRFLGLPISLVKGEKLVEFASKKAVVGFLKQNFPHLDVDSFFKAFQWRIPCVIHRNSCPAEAPTVRGEKRQREADIDEHTENPGKRSRKQCRAGNLKCGMETGRSVLLGPVPGLDCDICCVEPGFCRECTCILCCRTIVPDAGDCNLIRCLQRPSIGGICGHGAHLECALRSQMAGVVKERGLDMEYLCRRCDRKTDLRELVTRLLEAVGNTLQRSVAEKSLQLALQIMQGTEHGGNGARVLESLVQAALGKVQSGVDIQEVFSDLRDQGMAAEAAKQQCLGRATSNGEDASQQPEASLDQWLPSCGSPSSYPSPATPSSFSSPIIRRNASVSSPAGGTEVAEACDGNHTGADGHTDESGGAFRSSGSKFSSPGSEPSSIKTSQVRVTKHGDGTGSASSDINQEATFDSQGMAKNGKVGADELASRSLNLRTKSDNRGPTVGAGLPTREHCRSCGARQQSTQGLEVTSSLKFPKVKDGGRKSHRLSPARNEGEITVQNRVRHTHDAGKETDHPGTGSPCISSAAMGSPRESHSREVLGVPLQLLEDKCQQQVQFVLQKLRQAQQEEFIRAQERLIAQKDSMLKQYELLEIARNEYDGAEISSSHHLIDFDRLMLKLSNQLANASEERLAFERMLKVGEGFGRLSKKDLRKYYGWSPGEESRD